jgi:tetratricopeptide (TPR) repeat protein
MGDRLDPSMLVAVRAVRASLRAARGLDIEEDPEELVRLAEPTGEIQVIAMALVVAADLAALRDDADRALGHIREFERLTRDVTSTYRATNATTAVRVCQRFGDVDLAAAIVEPMDADVLLERIYRASAEAAVLEMRGRWDAAEEAYGAAASDWHRITDGGFEAAIASLGRGRCLRALGRDDDARSLFDAARERFMTLGAKRWVDAVDAASA